MTAVNVSRVTVLNNPAPFTAPLAFEIEYECLFQLQDDLEWKMIYVGSAESEKYDQVLDSVLVGPVYAGNYKFTFEGNPPDHAKMLPDDIVGVTVILLTCSYKGKEFIRIGYYVNNEYQEEELRENPPEQPIIDKLCRSILADHPRVTRFPVDFDSTSTDPGMQMDTGMAGTSSMQADDSAAMGAEPSASGQQQPGGMDMGVEMAGAYGAGGMAGSGFQPLGAAIAAGAHGYA